MPRISGYLDKIDPSLEKEILVMEIHNYNVLSEVLTWILSKTPLIFSSLQVETSKECGQMTAFISRIVLVLLR